MDATAHTSILLMIDLHSLTSLPGERVLPLLHNFGTRNFSPSQSGSRMLACFTGGQTEGGKRGGMEGIRPIP